jgi:pyrimidine deaminase RibD-like protein
VTTVIIQEILSHQSEKLDRTLVQLCDMIVQEHSRNPDPNGGRMVAATIYDPNGQTSMIISNEREDGLWNHAERNAIDQYTKDFGEIPNGSIMVTTLSPCGERLNSRYGESCVDLINEYPAIKLAYCGYDDRTQPMDQAKFEVTITANSKIKELCKEFADRVVGIKEISVR